MSDMNYGSNDNRNDINSSDQSIFKDRSEKVKNFTVHIEDDSDYGTGSYNTEQPVYKGEIYFANHSRATNGQTDVKRLDPVRTRTQPAPGQQRQPAQRVSQPQRNQQTRTPQKGKKKKKGAYFSASLKVLLSILICTVVLSGIGISTVNDILAIGREQKTVTVEIPENATTHEVIDVLADADLIKRPFFCKIFYDFECKIRKAKEPEYVTGIVNVKANMGLEGMLNRVKKSQTSAETVKLIFPEGWTVEKIFAKLEKYEVCDKDYLYDTIENVNFNYGFLSSAKQNNSVKRHLLLEGYLFPDTYEFFVDSNASTVIETFLTQFQNKWKDEYTSRANEMNLSIDEVITIASIIEKEAANQEQMGVISSVIHNRLNNPVAYPTIDCDSTGDYITNSVVPAVGKTKADVFRQYYNTYVCEGLPSGPICNPSINAIEAALYPEDTDYYFFQHDKNGEIYLAKTNAEHNRYRNEILLKNAR